MVRRSATADFGLEGAGSDHDVRDGFAPSFRSHKFGQSFPRSSHSLLILSGVRHSFTSLMRKQRARLVLNGTELELDYPDDNKRVPPKVLVRWQHLVKRLPTGAKG